MKKYRAIYPRLFTSVEVNGERVSIEFINGKTHPYFEGGVYISTSEAEQKAIESDCDFGKDFFLEEEQEEKSNIAETNEVEQELVEGISDYRAAQKWLVENKELTLQDVRTKNDIADVCKKLNIVFTDYEL